MNVVASDAEAVRRAFEGRTIVSYQAEEMALWERGPDGLPVFGHPRIPCVQCGSIVIGLEDGTGLRVQTNLSGHEWGLLVTGCSPDAGPVEAGAIRIRFTGRPLSRVFPPDRSHASP